MDFNVIYAPDGYMYASKDRTDFFEGILFCENGGTIDDYDLITIEEYNEYMKKLEKEMEEQTDDENRE